MAPIMACVLRSWCGIFSPLLTSASAGGMISSQSQSFSSHSLLCSACSLCCWGIRPGMSSDLFGGFCSPFLEHLSPSLSSSWPCFSFRLFPFAGKNELERLSSRKADLIITRIEKSRNPAALSFCRRDDILESE